LTLQKISAKNAFALHLIDYMSELFKKKEATDFQVGLPFVVIFKSKAIPAFDASLQLTFFAHLLSLLSIPF